MDQPWKTEVLPAPWQHAGLDCAIVRVSHSGHLCGYVRIPDGHPLHGVAYDQLVPEALSIAAKNAEEGPIGKRGILDIFCRALGADMRAGMLFDVHGGITYSSEIAEDGSYLPPGFWYGFDCAHAGDFCPVSAERCPDLYGGGDVYRDAAYVAGECESLARQLHALKALAA